MTQEDVGTPPLTIHERVLHTIQAYARLAVKRLGNVEVGGYLMAEPGGDVVDEALLAPSQYVTATSVRIDGHGVLAAGREMTARGKVAVGWFHSHGLMKPFESSVDVRCSRDIVAQLAAASQLVLERGLAGETTTHDGSVLFRDGPDTLVLDVGDPDLAAALIERGVRLRRQTSLACAYSLVVNSQGDAPHAELHTRRWCVTCETERVERRQIRLEIIPALALDEEQLLAEIDEKVHAERPARWLALPGGGVLGTLRTNGSS